MGKEDPCEVCGGTESRLVDGFYYCVECGTQDTNVRETVVEGQLLADGTFAKSRRVKYKVKVKEGVEMSEEWYKWHTFNFLLAGLTNQLIELGAAPSVRMKVLWMWARYVRKYQKKDEMTRTKVLNLLEDARSSSDSDSAGEGAGPGEGVEYTGKMADRVWRGHVDRYLLLALLGLALVHDRSPIHVSQLTRWVTYRLLSVNDARRFVPAAVLRRARACRPALARAALTTAGAAPRRMLRAMRVLQLGWGPMPDVEALVASQLNELRLPRGLARLVRGLMDLARVDWRLAKGQPPATFPAYEVTALAYILVALKMCFGLDDDYELRLTEAVDRVNVGRPRAFDSDPEPADRLFSFREWCTYIQHRKLVLTRNYAPLAWERNMRTTDFALMEHFEDFTTASRRNRAGRAELSDQVTMDVINKIPKKCELGVLPLSELRAAAAAREPHVALARLVAPSLPPARRRLLEEDFTQYDLDYAFKTLALPGHVFEGVSEAGKEFHSKLLMENKKPYESADKTTVFVKDCRNKNWARTKRPTARHVVVGEDLEECGDSSPTVEEEERKLETFEEEKEGGNIFDDDFFDVKIKDEKPDIVSGFPEADASEYVNESKDDVSWGGFDANFASTRRASVDSGRDPGPVGERRDQSLGGEVPRGVFDSDEESDGPQFDPATFNRAEIIKELMVAKYRKLSINPKEWNPRYKLDLPPKQVRRRTVVRNRDKHVEQRKYHDLKKLVAEERLAVGAIVAAYQSNLHKTTMVQVHQQVRAFADSIRADLTDDMEPLQDSPSLADRGQEGRSETAEAQDMGGDGDVEVVDGDSDGSIAGPAYDPVFRGDDSFNEATHDAAQLYLRLKEAPAPAAPDRHLDDTVSALIDKLRPPPVTYKRKPKPKRKKNIDHLIDNPDGMTKFNYWFKHYRLSNYFDYEHVSELELEQHLPRSFRFVLLEGAGTLGAAPAALYARVCAVERALLALIKKNVAQTSGLSRKKTSKPAKSQGSKKKKNNKKKNIPVFSDSDEDSRDSPNAKVSNSETSDDESDSTDSEVSCASKTNSNNRKRKSRPTTSENASDSEGSEASNVSRETSTKGSKKSRIQKDSSVSGNSSESEMSEDASFSQKSDNEGERVRRSGRLREKQDEHPFWR